uniref:CSON013264 protein n=1 Tax=Culicoides sonorensis TaxID=179676 RepID=A0A336KLX9_CULSO
MESLENYSEVQLLEFMRSSCRLCCSQSQSRINLLTKEQHGMNLMEMANSLTGLQISEFDNMKSLMVCLNCAGKIVSFHEFREQCQLNDKKISQMEMALRLKQLHNQSSSSHKMMEMDDDIEIVYVCKVCSLQFQDNELAKYKEHKKQHKINGETQANTTPVKKEEDKKVKDEQSKPVASAQQGLYPCRECSKSFNTYMSRYQHESNIHKKSASNNKSDDQPIAGKKSLSLKRLRRVRHSPIPKHQADLNSTAPVSGSKIYTCDSCDETFINHKAKYWHRIKAHGFIFGKGKAASTSFSCRHCDKVFDKRHSKYNHERICPSNVFADEKLSRKKRSLEPPKAVCEDSLELIEQQVSVEPIVELTEDGSNDATIVEGLVKCSRCNDEFTSSRARSLHEKNVHNLQVNECRNCTRVFASYATRYQHEKRCNGNTSMNSGQMNDEETGTGEDATEEESGFQNAYRQSF